MGELQPAGVDPVGVPYGEWLEQIKRRVSDAQRRAAHAVNAELIGVYWEIGREIHRRQVAEDDRPGPGGPRIIQRLSADLAVAFPGTRSFGARNLRYMRQFAVAWPEREMLQHGAATLPWGHIMLLLDRLDDRAARDWYAIRASAEGWTRKVLDFNISTDLRIARGGGGQQLRADARRGRGRVNEAVAA